jgi:hypothetical protein
MKKIEKDDDKNNDEKVVKYSYKFDKPIYSFSTSHRADQKYRYAVGIINIL